MTRTDRAPEALEYEERESEIQQVTFYVTKLYGISTHSVEMPINKTSGLESGQVCLTIDPDVSSAGNIGVIDYAKSRLDVRYSAQIVFPGLYKLITDGGYDPQLLAPIQAVATDRCTLAPDMTGWHAVGCLEFLPGSYWSGAQGG